MKKYILLAFVLMPFSPQICRGATRESNEIVLPAQGVGVNKTIDMTPYAQGVGVQAVYSNGTPASHTLTSGAKRIATLTVSATSSALIATYPSVTINTPSTSTIQGKSVVINGVRFKCGTEWTAATSSMTAAASLAAKIDAHPDFIATVSGATVTVKYAVYGSAGNGLPITTDSAASYNLSAATFSGGVPQESIIINGVTLTGSVDWTATVSSRTTAGSITSAINANTTLLAQVIASSGTTGSVVTITALEPGASANYYLTSSTGTGLTVVNFTGGFDAEISLSTDRITKASHGLTTGMQVRYDTTAGTAPGGLVTGTTYFAIKNNENQYQLATTSTTAVAGTAIDITSLPSTVATYTMTPLSLVTLGGNGFKWQGSNDGTNFSDLSVSSVTYSTAGNTLWDFGTYPYRWLRMVFSPPTSGGIALTVRIRGKE